MAKLSKLDQLEPLKVTCTSSDCESGLHCFKATRQMKAKDEIGKCRSCGVDFVDWDRIHQQNLNDVEYTFDALKHEMIRHHFWHVEIDQKAINYAKRKGVSGLELAVPKRLRSSVGAGGNPYDGRQTPMEGSGNPIHYAQHATATCCRECIEYWHAVPPEIDLDEDRINYFSELVMMYIKDRLPDLGQEGIHVPPIRKARKRKTKS